MKNSPLLLIVLLVCSLSAFSQSKREIPPSISTITAVIEQSVSFSSYKKGTDSIADWYNKADEGDVFFFNDTLFCVRNANGDKNVTAYLDSGIVKENFESCLTHGKESYWQFNNQSGTVENEKNRGAFGFRVQGGMNNALFLIEVNPYDATFDELDANYDPRPGFYRGTTTITVQENGESVWVFYCRNVIN